MADNLPEPGPRVGSPKPVVVRGASQRSRARERQIEDLGAALIELRQDSWACRDTKDREAYLIEVDKRYQGFVNEFHLYAAKCGERFERFFKRYTAWKHLLILTTGLLAIINLLAAYKHVPDPAKDYWGGLPLFAAVFAASLTILASLESFHNYMNRAQAYRESRELFLDAAREFVRLWDVYVRPFGDGAEACANASEIYRRIVVKDRELRAKLKDLTKEEKKGGGQKS